MSLSCLFSLGDGITFHRFRKNPFRPAKPGRSSFLVSVKPVSTQPIQPALDSRTRDLTHAGPTPFRACLFGIRSYLSHARSPCPQRQPARLGR